VLAEIASDASQIFFCSTALVLSTSKWAIWSYIKPEEHSMRNNRMP
jgi:hypothetical protein